ncbi:unnamed protein product [Cyprideis torosa]|uniref:Uncharacterized protein n=1 Tax=Cyprideis torosa TaxID=163714 RepID=A0A7R8WI39_9CRUS|nr:unnamed protein product [Cyprideis torosa]CAG0900222.1 unnamed protein product [Cyprideis torosa]
MTSLRNCETVWYPEIRRFCPTTPIVLVGCQNDLRSLVKDENYIRLCEERWPMVRCDCTWYFRRRGTVRGLYYETVAVGRSIERCGKANIVAELRVREADLVMPDQARRVALLLNCPYYETSVLTMYGVADVCENAIRAALSHKKQSRFWMTNLKRIQRPLPQEPFRPPKPTLPAPVTIPSSYPQDLASLLENQRHTDLIFLVGHVGFCAHRFFLIATWPKMIPMLAPEFACHLSYQTGSRRVSDASIRSSFGDIASSSVFLDLAGPDTECLLPPSETCTPEPSPRRRPRERRRSCHSFSCLSQFLQPSHPNHCVQSAFQFVKQEKCEGLDAQGKPTSGLQTLVGIHSDVPPASFALVLQFVYTGEIKSTITDVKGLQEHVHLFDIPELTSYLNNLISGSEEARTRNDEISRRWRQRIASQLDDIYLRNDICARTDLCGRSGGPLLTDTTFELEGGALRHAHRAMLMSRCDVLKAMFQHTDFRESSAKLVTLPGVSDTAFSVLLYYLYTDSIPILAPSEAIPIVELANRFCLPRLVSLVELEVIQQLNHCSIIKAGYHAIVMLEPAQMYNAEQLVEWCFVYIISHYTDICRQYHKEIKLLHPETQRQLNTNRWPPVWYLKDYDHYELLVLEREREDKPLRKRKRSGCLCLKRQSSFR